MSVLCGCGRDYAQVPLEEAHECPSPVLRRCVDCGNPVVEARPRPGPPGKRCLRCRREPVSKYPPPDPLD
jgi:hypothetical protein